MKVSFKISGLRKGQAKKLHAHFAKKFNPDGEGYNDPKGTFNMQFHDLNEWETLLVLAEIFWEKLIKNFSISIKFGREN